MASGGIESTKNTMEQTNFGEIDWVLLGAIAGTAELYPERYDASGYLNNECTNTAGTTVWSPSADYTACVDAWKATLSGSALCVEGSADTTVSCADNKTCYPSNNSGLTAYLAAAADTACDLVHLEHGFSQW